jgi:hypothetical protein
MFLFNVYYTIFIENLSFYINISQLNVMFVFSLIQFSIQFIWLSMTMYLINPQIIFTLIYVKLFISYYIFATVHYNIGIWH